MGGIATARSIRSAIVQQVLRFEHGRSKSGYISTFEIHPQGLVVQSVDTRVGMYTVDNGIHPLGSVMNF